VFMKSSSLSFFFGFIFALSILSSQAFADPVNNGEPLSPGLTCPTPRPPFCPTGTPCPTCSICPSPSLCPVCTPSGSPSGSPTPVGCQGYYQVDFRHTGVYKKTDVKVDATKAAGLSCFEDIVNKVIDKIPGYYLPDTFNSSVVLDKKGNELREKTGQVFTAYLWDYILEASGLNRNSYQANKQYLNCTGAYVGVTHNGYAQIGGGYEQNNKGKTPGCTKGNFKLDPSCRLIKANADLTDQEDCGDINIYTQISTPVSLVWSESYKDQSSTLVNFKLNPHSDANTWLWRGSEALPLLVYDPEHTGMINSASQLFGNWTFGGNGLASLNEGATQGTPWRDGYEALSKMDKDLDGRVSGGELKDLALWFDKNQDGISQNGEVKTLSEVSVTALFYQADKKEAGAIVATRGYEREVDGKVVVASSMDWMEKGLKDGFDLLLDSMHSKQALNSSQVKVAAKDLTMDASEHAKDVAPAVYGVWGWTIDLPAKGSGFLALDQSEEGVAGVTLSQLGMLGVPDVDSQLIFSHFVGSSQKTAEGVAEVKFEVSGENGSMLTNTASLSKDGNELVGKTVVSGSSLSESGSYEYSWKAVRLK